MAIFPAARTAKSLRRRAIDRGSAPLAVLILAVCAQPPMAAAQTDAWRDDFAGAPVTMPDGSSKLYPDPKRWAFTFRPGVSWPDSFGDGTNWLEANGECQVYLTPFSAKAADGSIVPVDQRHDPFRISDEGLHIRASVLKSETIAAYKLRPGRIFGSGLLTSRASFKYGRVTLRARLPAARGSWPAFWLLPEDGGWPPEIDVFEGMNWGPRARQLHVGLITTPAESQSHGGWVPVGSDPSQSFHDYTLEWNEQTISISYDGQTLLQRKTPESMKRPMYILINLAVGGRWPYNELGVAPIEGMSDERLVRGSELVKGDYPAELVIRSLSVAPQ